MGASPLGESGRRTALGGQRATGGVLVARRMAVRDRAPHEVLFQQPVGQGKPQTAGGDGQEPVVD